MNLKLAEKCHRRNRRDDNRPVFFSLPGPKLMAIHLVSVCRPSVSTFNQLFLSNLQADLNHLSSVACLWWGIDDKFFMEIE